MIHQHNSEEHQALDNAVDKLEVALNDLYINDHNGDTKRNRRIMRCVKLQTEIKAMLEMHSRNTRNVDEEWKQGQEAIAREKNRAETVKAGWKKILWWVLAAVGTIAISVLSSIFISKSF